MSQIRLFLLTALAMVAFAGNSLLCRAALRDTTIDPFSFTLIRLASGAAILWLIMKMTTAAAPGKASWRSSFALFAYAAAFAFAYAGMSTATGALLLFATVQVTMFAVAFWRGERLTLLPVAGLALAVAGTVALLLPGLAMPDPVSALMMSIAGVAWGVYSLRAAGSGDPTVATAGNFARAALLAAVLSIITLPWSRLDVVGITYAVLSGGVTSGLGYVVWYSVLRGLNAMTAAMVQLSVPIIAALGAVLFLAEPLTVHLLMTGSAVLGGLALATFSRFVQKMPH